MKRKKPANLNQKSRDYYERQGFLVGTVERYIAVIRQRFDFLGIIDAIGVSVDLTLGIQTTSIDHRADHLEKIYWKTTKDKNDKVIARVPNLNTFTWLHAGRLLVLACWAKRKLVRGGTAFRYEIDETYISLADFKKVTKGEQHEGDLVARALSS